MEVPLHELGDGEVFFPNAQPRLSSVHRERLGQDHANSIDQVEELAYLLWRSRGCPEGTPEVDWFRAERAMARRGASTPSR